MDRRHRHLHRPSIQDITYPYHCGDSWTMKNCLISQLGFYSVPHFHHIARRTEQEAKVLTYTQSRRRRRTWCWCRRMRKATRRDSTLLAWSGLVVKPRFEAQRKRVIFKNWTLNHNFAVVSLRWGWNDGSGRCLAVKADHQQLQPCIDDKRLAVPCSAHESMMMERTKAEWIHQHLHGQREISLYVGCDVALMVWSPVIKENTATGNEGYRNNPSGVVRGGGMWERKGDLNPVQSSLIVVGKRGCSEFLL